MENYESISVMSASDQCNIETNTLVSASTAAASPVLGQLTSDVGVNVKHEIGANRVFVVTDKSQIDALQVRQNAWQTHTCVPTLKI